jgi:hypothetical protein
MKHKQWTMQTTYSIPVFSFHINYNIILMYILYILERLSLAVPRKYVHSGLVLGLDWTLCHLSSILYLSCLSWPTHQLVVCSNGLYFTNKHVHPPLTTRRLNTAIQVNNMGARHLMYNGHIYGTSHTATMHSFFYTSSTLLGRPAGPDHLCRNS